VPQLEQDFCRDFTCCGLTLPDLHELVGHFEEAHVRVIPESQKDTISPPTWGGLDSPSEASSGASTPPLMFDSPSESLDGHSQSAFATFLSSPRRRSSSYFDFASRKFPNSGPRMRYPLHLGRRESASTGSSDNGDDSAMDLDLGSASESVCLSPTLLVFPKNVYALPPPPPPPPTVQLEVRCSSESTSPEWPQQEPPKKKVRVASDHETTITWADSPPHPPATGRRPKSQSHHRRHRAFKPFKCPHPGCTKTYLNANGLRYHLNKGTCEFETSSSDEK